MEQRYTNNLKSRELNKKTLQKTNSSPYLSIHIQPSILQGDLTIPPSKSHTLRAILFAFLAKGTSHIHQFLPSPDTYAMIEAVKSLGAKVEIEGETLHISGVSGKPSAAEDVIQCGNSGLVLRLIGAIAGLIPHYTILTGDASIRHKRPVKPLLSALTQLGAFATSSRGDNHAPILICGPLRQGKASLEAQDSQPVSGLLIAAAFAPHPIEIHAINPGEKPWIDLTLHWLTKCKIPFIAKDHTYYRLEGNGQIESFTYKVPGDFSTAAFPIAAAILTGSSLTLHNLDMNEIQGDKELIPILQKMGANLEIDSENRKIHIHPGSSLQGQKIDINTCIDALPILAVIGCFAKGKTELVNCHIARHKESDRISTIASELRKMGALLEEKEDSLTIYPSSLQGATLLSHHDHRIALSLAMAALASKNPSVLHDIGCIEKTYPEFIAQFQTIGAKIEKSNPLRI